MAENTQIHTSLHATCYVTSEFTMHAASIEPNSFNLPLSPTYHRPTSSSTFHLPPDKSCRGDADPQTPARHREAEGRFRRPCPLQKMSDAALGLRILRPDSLIITLTVLSARHGAGVGTCVKSPGTIDKPPTDASYRWLMQVWRCGDYWGQHG